MNLKTKALFVCLAAFSSLAATAQNLERIHVTLSGPVAVGSGTLPAGDYTVRELSSDAAQPVFQFHSSAGFNAIASAQHITSTLPASQTKLTFTPGVLPQLDDLWFAGSTEGYRILSLIEPR